MSAFRKLNRSFRLPKALGPVVLGAVLVCGSVMETGHADIDCTHDACGLCVGSSSDGALVDTAASIQASPCMQCLGSAPLARAAPEETTLAQLIRGPPGA